MCAQQCATRGLKPEVLRTGSGAVLALYVYQVGSSHRRPTQAQALTNRLPRIASLPGAHWHFRASDRGSWGYAYGPG